MRETLFLDKEQIRRVCVKVEEFLYPFNISQCVSEDVVVSVDEALTNIYQYAFSCAKYPEKPVSIALKYTGDMVRVDIEDSGCPFNLSSVEEPVLSTYLESEKIGGFGITLIRKLMSRVEYNRVGERNHLRMERQCKTV